MTDESIGAFIVFPIFCGVVLFLLGSFVIIGRDICRRERLLKKSADDFMKWGG